MERDLVDIVINGNTFAVSQDRLAENMKRWEKVARYLGKRPGEPTDNFPPNEKHSADKMAVMTTILYDSKSTK